MKKYNLSSYFQSIILLLASFCSFSVFGQTTNYTGQSNQPTTTPTTNLGVINPPAENTPHRVNFVRTYSAQVPIQSERDMRNQPTEKVVVTTGYMDGLGRMIQSNMRDASPSKKDIIQVANYDQYGRQAKQYLPFTKQNGGNYEQNGLKEQYLFYRNEPNITHTNYAFIEADIENSPMARMNEVGNVGEHWKLGNGHTRSATTRTNTENDRVLIWEFSDNCKINVTNFYEKFQLYVSEVKDEDGTHIQTFIDKSGKTILKRVEGEEREWLETYYIYDEYNRLTVILPPETSKLATQGSSYYTCEGNGAFRYDYDNRGRLITKYTPGKNKFPTRIIYDQLDRPIFVQTPEQYDRKEYSFTKYDQFNRPVFSGMYTSPAAYIQNEFASVMQETVLFEERNTNENTHFYTHRTFQNLQGTYEIHTVTYYDDYDFIENHPDSINAPFRFRTPPMNEAARPTYKTKGMATGSKVLLLTNTSNPLSPSGFQTSIIYYDDYGRPIQVQKENHKNGLDISYTKYDFAGKVLETVTKHETDVHELKVRYEYTYDHVGRPLEVKQRIQTPTTSNIATPNQDREKIVSRYQYNELGQVTQKQLHSENDGVTFLQDVDFKYNVRGWLTHINDSELTDTRDIFGMELSYETGFEEVQHNGNISGVKWKSATNNVERSYGFAYDKLGRLKRANYHAKDQNTGAWTAENENYTVWDLNYDLDGNILSVKRNGLLKEDGQTKVFGLIDDLEYSYRRLDNRGKMLVGVEDRAEFETASKDFKDGNRGDDYSYNYEGSIISDKNKGVSFEYNHLGRVNKIINTNNPTDKIDYLYDATGSKLQKTVKEGARTKKIDYVNGFQYRNDTLDFFPMPEGRIVFKDGEYIPEYHFKDHLGNLRLAFQVTDRQNARYALTMETDSATSEEKAFENVKVARTDLKEQKGAYSARLTNADKAIYKTIKVEKGDKISAKVFATNDPEIAQTDPNKAIDKAKKDVLLSLGSAAAGVVTTNPTQQEIEIPAVPEVSPATTKIIKTPRIGINLLDFIPVIRNLRELKRAKRAKNLEPDSYHVPRGELVLQLRDSTDSLIVEKRQKITISATVSWQKLVSELTIEQDGNLTVFIDNQDTEAVYFDNLELRVESDPTLVITQEHHYYPFGMNMSGIERDGELKYQFNGMVEKEEAFGLELYETPFRSYDAQLGRFWQVEPLADEYHGVSMYQFGYNNPISHNDPTGLYSIREAWRSIRWGIKSFVDKLGGGDGKVSINTTDWQGNRGHNTWTSAMNTNKLDRETKGQAHQQAKEFLMRDEGQASLELK
ncbi:RHS repeat-associated core domain protein [Bernardetia litoralis DSM 6794]|uniref:RHS repeat-associated core domain protein n=1 Tax=Bernardetia litoralis (strain ATCC 23117 / DSM 6794 / NBRC 15988 / NCIMB 1366 / Fx l1 / Sio-4) TaxID=880071 RepID=I4AFC5_BERLS|nr:DUF6443 domain-containing protein [Bernardetia litoralis]AFM02660.1 RHS repeat-associated core domain protein [Bernardetia litoralis DSM 6794]